MLEVGSAFRVPTFRNYTLVNPQVGSPRDLGVRHFEPSKMMLSKLFTYPLTKLPKPNEQINLLPSPHVATLVFTLYSRWSFGSTRGFYSPQEVFGV